MRPLALSTALAALAFGAPAVSAAPILSTSQGAFATAQSVNGFFTLDASTNVQDSTTIAHVEISQAGRPSDGYDFYFFSHAGGTVHLDIDGPTNFDTEIGIWTAGGTLVSNNDDNFPLDLGSSTLLNSALFNLNLAAGDYVVGVSRFNSVFQSGAPYITGLFSMVPQGGTYTLNISATPVPEPVTLTLLGIGIVGVGGLGRRLRRKS